MSSLAIFAPNADGVSRRIGEKLRSTVRALQHQRMIGVLSGMSDAQLDMIGVARSEIRDHARTCVYGAGK